MLSCWWMKRRHVNLDMHIGHIHEEQRHHHQKPFGVVCQKPETSQKTPNRKLKTLLFFCNPILGKSCCWMRRENIKTDRHIGHVRETRCHHHTRNQNTKHQNTKTENWKRDKQQTLLCTPAKLTGIRLMDAKRAHHNIQAIGCIHENQRHHQHTRKTMTQNTENWNQPDKQPASSLQSNKKQVWSEKEPPSL